MNRILYFSRDYTTHDHRFLSALVSSGYQVYSMHLERRGHALEDRPVPAGVEQVQWAGGTRPARLSSGLALLLDLKKTLGKIKPDLVQVGPIQTAAFLVALTGFQPLVSMSWGYDLLVDARRDRTWGWATRYTLQHSAAMIGDCQTVRHAAVSFGMPAEQIVTAPWGVDLAHFIPAEAPGRDQPTGICSRLGWGEEAFVLLSTRAWEPIYGVDILADAFVRAAKEHPELRLMMLGNGSLAGQLRQTFLQGGVDDRVYFPGQVKQADLPNYYQAADLYISASHSDGTSISLLEALASGCPALLADIPGNLEWITPGVQGWYFHDGNPVDLAAVIVKAVENRKDMPNMRLAARRLAEQRADWDMNFKILLQAYRLAGLR